jgi:ribosomal-protein-serine acetyltransferase
MMYHDANMFRWSVRDDLELRLMEEVQAEEIFALVEHNRRRLRPWLPWVEATEGPENVRHFIRSALTQFAENNGFHAGMWHQGRYAGAVGFHKIDWTNRKVEMGYWIGEEFEGRGFVVASCRALIGYAFAVWKLNRVEIHCAAGNVRSNRVPQRLGFRLDGVMRGAHCLYGEFHDLNYYGMLARDWSRESADGVRRLGNNSVSQS